MLEVTALDSFFAGLTTAFFGAIVAGGAYLLKQHLALQTLVARLAHDVQRLQAVRLLLDEYGRSQADMERFKQSQPQGRGDEPE